MMNRRSFLVLCILLLAPATLRADGGLVRARAVQGAFIVTIFTPPEVSSATPTDISVLVQRRDSGEAVLDAAVALNFTPPAGASILENAGLCGLMNTTVILGNVDVPGQYPSVPATRAQATNRLLYAASVILPAMGDWRLSATVRQGSDESSLTCRLPVAAPPLRLASLWPYLAVPPIAVALFALHQWLGFASRARRTQPLTCADSGAYPPTS